MGIYAAALDIGYSNLSLMHGELGRKMHEVTIPATAVLSDKDAVTFNFEHHAMDKSTNVMVGGREWNVGLEAYRVGKGKRELNSNFPKTEAYMAMYYGALMELNTNEVDILVTGLPVEQALDKEWNNHLIKTLEGKHRISKKRHVTVKKVVLLPQPAAAYVDYQRKNMDDAIYFNQGTVLIIDSGFYSVDHVVLQRGRFIEDCSGTSLFAMSALLENAAKLISKDYGKVEKEILEDAIQKQEKNILVKGNIVELKSYLEKASEAVATKAIKSIKESLRHQEAIDFTLLVGGGARFYENAAKEHINYCSKFVVAEEPHKTVVKGYMSTALALAEKLSKQHVGREQEVAIS